MKMTLLLSMISLAGLGGITPTMAAQQERAVLAQDMKDLGAVALWTRRNGYCTLQIIMEHPVTIARPTTKPGEMVAFPLKPVMAAPPVTQAWVLRPDGTSMPAIRTATEMPKGIRDHTVTITYSFPESASREGAALAVMINGKYYVEHLETFPDEK